MEWMIQIKRSVDDTFIEIDAARAGEDVIVCITGGQKPHVGCAAVAVPRPSLTGDQSIRATASVLNLPGHKDELLCRSIAESVCAAVNCTVVCTGGFHVDDASPDLIEAVVHTVKEMTQELAERLMEYVNID